jgi:hypothetical protein
MSVSGFFDRKSLGREAERMKRIGMCGDVAVLPACLAAAALALAGCGGGGGGGGGPPPPPANRAPAFTSAGTASVPENSSGTIYTATANDADGDALTFSLSGGADQTRL